jgi:hypothetical protein
MWTLTLLPRWVIFSAMSLVDRSVQMTWGWTGLPAV